MTYREIYNEARARLEKSGNKEAGIDAFYLLEYAFGIVRSDYYLLQNEAASEEKTSQYFEYISQAEKGRPVDYITGVRDFYGFSFKVNEDVLIPRQDTEHLVEAGLSFLKGKDNIAFLDLCTGSGCIAVTLSKMLEKAGIKHVAEASDISDGALLVAKENAAANEANVTFVKSDMFEAINDSFDLILSNPPYIPEGERVNLDKKVVDFEPAMALFAGEDGLDFYKIIAKESRAHLKEGGMLALEIGYDQGISVPKLLEDQGFKDIKVIKDYNGLDRVVTGLN